MQFKRTIAAFIFAGFISMGVFGAALMDYSMKTHGGCAAAAFTGSTCTTNISDELAHHLTAVQMFSTFFLPIGIAFVLLAALLLTALGPSLFISEISPHWLFLHKRERQVYNRHRASFLHWLALFELSPSR